MNTSSCLFLSDVPTGSWCRMEPHVEGGIALRAAAFGLLPGTGVEVIRNTGRGAVIVHAQDTYLAVGPELARHLEVRIGREASHASGN